MPLLFQGRNRVTSLYRGSGRPDHDGIDIVGDDSTDILCTVDGVVKSSTIVRDKTSPTWSWGNYVRVDDAKGNKHFFCHMASRAARVGQKVKIGDKLGIMGSTGYSTGAHTHYEVRAAAGANIDPTQFLGIPNEFGTYTAKTGWEETNGRWYYYFAGEMFKNRWLHDADGYWYRLGTNGAMLTGLHKIDGKLYMLNPKRVQDVPTGACIVTDEKGVIQLG